MLETIALAMAAPGSNNMFMSGEAMVVLGPEHASIAAREGFDKAAVRQLLFERARIPLESIGQGPCLVLRAIRR